MMKHSTKARENAERHFFPVRDRDEKGSAMSTISADALVVRQKSARLRELRLAHEATIFVTPVKARNTGKRAA